jgi:hypothetical protein
VAIENARLYEEVRRNEERIEKELRFAQRVQMALLPTEPPAGLRDADVAGHFAPARELGGDLHDFLLPAKFELQVAGLRQSGDCAVCYGKTRFYNYRDGPTDVAWKRTGERISTMFPSFLQSRWWDTSTPLYRREVTDLAGPWTELRNEEDWEYDCRIAGKGGRLHYCDAFVSDTRVAFGYQLSTGGSGDPEKLRDRAAAHRLILQHALAAHISHETPEMKHFARELFLLARQCGAAGLGEEARILFERARQASDSLPGQVTEAFQLVLGRKPSAEELTAYTAYTRQHGLSNLSRVLFNTNEFVFVD